MLDEYGKIVFKLPNLINGDYQFRIQGTDLGRVWVDDEESVSLDSSTGPVNETETENETEAETEAPETEAAGGPTARE